MISRSFLATQVLLVVKELTTNFGEGGHIELRRGLENVVANIEILPAVYSSNPFATFVSSEFRERSAVLTVPTKTDDGGLLFFRERRPVRIEQCEVAAFTKSDFEGLCAHHRDEPVEERDELVMMNKLLQKGSIVVE